MSSELMATLASTAPPSFAPVTTQEEEESQPLSSNNSQREEDEEETGSLDTPMDLLAHHGQLARATPPALMIAEDDAGAPMEEDEEEEEEEDEREQRAASASPVTMSSLLVQQLKEAVNHSAGNSSSCSGGGSSPRLAGGMGGPVEEEKKRKFVCRYCQKGFSLMNVLKVHERIHTGEKPYSCEICKKAFNQSGSLNRHRNTHKKRYHDNRCYSCRFCASQFLYASHLQDHETSAHASELAVLEPKTSNSPSLVSEETPLPTMVSNAPTVVMDPIISRHQLITANEGLSAAVHAQVAPCNLISVHNNNNSGSNRMKTMTSSVGGETLVCELCDASFTSKADLQTHHNQHYVQQLAMMVMSQDPTAANILFPNPTITVTTSGPPAPPVPLVPVPGGPQAAIPFTQLLSRIQNQNNAVAVLAALQRQQQQQQQQQQQNAAASVIEQLVAIKKELPGGGQINMSPSKQRTTPNSDRNGHPCKYCGKNFAQNGTLRRHHQTCKHGPHRTALSVANQNLPHTTLSGHGPLIAPRITSGNSTNQLTNSCTLTTANLSAVLATASPCGSSGVAGDGSKSGRMAGTDASSEVGSVSPGMDSEGAHDKVDGPEDLSIYANIPLSTPTGRSKDPSLCSPARSLSPATSASGRGTPRQPSNSRRLEDICAALLEKSAKTVPSSQPSSGPASGNVAAHSPTQNFLANIGSTKVDHCELKDLMRYLTLSGKLYRCEHCQIFFLDSAMFHLHRGMHDTAMPYRCAICAFQADDKYRFQLHFMEHKQHAVTSAPMDTSTTTTKMESEAEEESGEEEKEHVSPSTLLHHDNHTADDVTMITPVQ